MSPVPSGSVTRIAPDQYDLTLTRTFSAPIEDVWASVTESERTARWFARWRGEPGAGRTVEMQMGFEEGDQWLKVRIDACEPPRRLAVTSLDGAGEWILELRLSESDGVTELEFVQHLGETTQVENTGPGWEYYLDALVASRSGETPPNFDDYYPAQQAYYQGKADAAG